MSIMRGDTRSPIGIRNSMNAARRSQTELFRNRLTPLLGAVSGRRAVIRSQRPMASGLANAVFVGEYAHNRILGLYEALFGVTQT